MQTLTQTRTAVVAGVPARLRAVLILLSASVFLALCARVSLPLPFSPVPLSLQNFGVLLLALVLGPRRATAAVLAYLGEGALGLPVFSPAGPGGLAQLLGPTGGFLMAYPAVAFIAGWLHDRLGNTRRGAILAGAIGDLVLFVGGMSWLMVVTGVSLAAAFAWAVVPFIPGEVLKVAAATAISGPLNARRWLRD